MMEAIIPFVWPVIKAFFFTIILVWLLKDKGAQADKSFPLSYRIGFYLGNNNNQAKILWVVTIFFFFLVLFYGFGEPIISSLAKKALRSSYNKDLYAWDEEEINEKSWIPFILFISLFVFTAIFTIFAYREEAAEAWSEATWKIRERRETKETRISVLPAANANPAEAQTTEAPKEKKKGIFPSLFTLFNLDLLAEFAGELIMKVMADFVTRRNR